MYALMLPPPDDDAASVSVFSFFEPGLIFSSGVAVVDVAAEVDAAVVVADEGRLRPRFLKRSSAA